MVVQPKVAVIGAGAAGLCVTRVVLREMGVGVKVLEAKAVSGGVWRYFSKRDHPMYRDLKTNRPKELMGYREKPWNSPGDSFVSHQAVQEYLMEYQSEFDLKKHIQFSCPVTQLTILDKVQGGGYSSLSPDSESWPRIMLEYGKNGEKSEIFDAVFVCKGSFTTPSVPEIPGMAQHFRGKVLHSVSYDNPEEFQGKSVLCIGGAASGTDLAREISQHADQVYLSSPFLQSNLEFHCVPGERRVMPLYKQFWHAQYPNLCFIGVPHHIIPFPLFEFQAEAAVSQFKSFSFPTPQSRMDEAYKDSTSGGAKVGGSIRDTHFLGSAQWDYCRMMAKLGRVYDQEVESFIATNKAIYDDSEIHRSAIFPGGPDHYRNNQYHRQGNDWRVDLHA